MDIHALKTTTVILFWILCTALAYAEATLTLDKFLTDVVKSHPLLLASEQRSYVSSELIKPAGALDDPFFAIGVDEVPFGEHTFDTKRYQLSQNLPFPGKRQTKENIAEFQAKVSELSTNALRREIIVIATQTFYKALLNERQLELNSELIDLVEVLLNSAKARYQGGGIEHHELLLSQIERSSLDIERLNLLRGRDTLYREMNELTGGKIEYSHLPLVANFTDHLIEHTPSVLDDQPEVHALATQAQRAEQQVKLAELDYYPDFVLQAMTMTTVDDMDETMSSWGLMIGVTMPIYANSKQSRVASAARYEQYALTLEKQNLLNRLRNEQLDAIQQFQAAKDIVELYEQSIIPQTELAMANAKFSYAANKLSLSSYLGVLKAQHSQRLEHFAAKIDMELALLRQRELLSAPPLLRLAPISPSLFGNDVMGSMGRTMDSGAVSMGRAMKTLKKATNDSSNINRGGGSGMSGM